jgi:protein-tyrosine-phosphatase
LSAGSEPLRVLFVCTANICRSPAAEHLARARFGEDRAVFRSAGYLTAGEPCPPPLLRALSELGVDASAHRSYLVDQASLAAADLVLTMEGQHVPRATRIDPVSLAHVLPLKEALAVLTRLPGAQVGLDDFLAALAQVRDPRSYLAKGWDVDDPYRRRLKQYRRAVTEIDQLVTKVIGRLV